MLAITHEPSPQLGHCQRTFVPRKEICCETAARQHRQYCRVLRELGVNVHTLDANREFPDSVFIEDTAIVLDEVAILASMGAASRVGEPAGIETELSRHREIRRIQRPGMLEGGDVLRVDRTLLVGVSARTNRAGAAALAAIAGPLGYRVIPVPVQGCLHLKTACTALPDQRLLVNPDWVNVELLRPYTVLPVPESEPWAANTVVIDQRVLLSANHIRTASLLRRMGFGVHTVDVSEFAKAEGGVTCLSILLNGRKPCP